MAREFDLGLRTCAADFLDPRLRGGDKLVIPAEEIQELVDCLDYA